MTPHPSPVEATPHPLPPPAPTRAVQSRSRLRPVVAALGAVAAAQAAADLRERRSPLRGPALPLALAAGWVAMKHATAPRPLLTYTRELRRDTTTATTVPAAGLWTVRISNTGTAPAQVSGTAWFGTRTDGRVVTAGDALALTPLFDDCGVADDDYLLVRLTPGWSLAPGATETLCELPPAVAVRFASLGAVFTLHEPFGARSTYRVEAIPPHGLPQAVVLAAGHDASPAGA